MDKEYALGYLKRAISSSSDNPLRLINNPAFSHVAFGEWYDDEEFQETLKSAFRRTTEHKVSPNELRKYSKEQLDMTSKIYNVSPEELLKNGYTYTSSHIDQEAIDTIRKRLLNNDFESVEDFTMFENMLKFNNDYSINSWKDDMGFPIEAKESVFDELGAKLRRNGKTEHYVANKLRKIQNKANELGISGFNLENLINRRLADNIEQKKADHEVTKNNREEWIKYQRRNELEAELDNFPKGSPEYIALEKEINNLTASILNPEAGYKHETLQLNPPREGAPMFEGMAVPSVIADAQTTTTTSGPSRTIKSDVNMQLDDLKYGDNFIGKNGELYVYTSKSLKDPSLGIDNDMYEFQGTHGNKQVIMGNRHLSKTNFRKTDNIISKKEIRELNGLWNNLDVNMRSVNGFSYDPDSGMSVDEFEGHIKSIMEKKYIPSRDAYLNKVKELQEKYPELQIDDRTQSEIDSTNKEYERISNKTKNTGEKAVEETVENMGDTVEETIENTAETVIKNVAAEAGEETVETIIKQTTGVNVELDGINKKRTPKKLKKGTGKYKGKTKELYDRLDNSRYWAVDFPGSNGDFAVHGPNGTKRLEKESIDQQRRRRKYEQTRQKYERRQQQRQEQKQKDFVDNTMHIDDEIDLDELNKQWYESKQKEFDQKQKEIDDYFENNADIDPEDVLKDDYEPDINKYTDDIDYLDKNFEQGKNFDINKGVNEALDAANRTVDAGREGGSISKYLKEFSNMGFIEKAMTLGNIAGAVSDYKDARREGHGVVSSVARAGVNFALSEAMGLYYPIFALAKEAPGLIVKGSEMLYKENRKMNSMANQQIFGGAQFQDTQQLATMRQSGMEMAKMAQYNLQQTLMGQEATYLHR